MIDAGTVDRLAEIKRQMEALKLEADNLQGEILRQAEMDLTDTKRKTVSYPGTGGAKVTATMSDSVKVIYPSYLIHVFGLAARDVLTEVKSLKISVPATRMLAGIFKGNYLRMTVQDVLEQLKLDADTTKVLRKKVRGINYDKDTAALVAIGHLTEAEAQETAYLAAEAAVWESFFQLMAVNGYEHESELEEIIQTVRAAIIVEETPKISIEAGV